MSATLVTFHAHTSPLRPPSIFDGEDKVFVCASPQPPPPYTHAPTVVNYDHPAYESMRIEARALENKRTDEFNAIVRYLDDKYVLARNEALELRNQNTLLTHRIAAHDAQLAELTKQMNEIMGNLLRTTETTQQAWSDHSVMIQSIDGKVQRLMHSATPAAVIYHHPPTEDYQF